MIHTFADTPRDRPRILVIMGSVRAGRLCPVIASWVMAIGGTSTGLELELVDLAEWRLPLEDEPGIPALGHYTQDHTLAWSRKIAAAQGFVVVTPQYNWGYPAALKNALDHLYAEWAGKPLVIVSYGGHGGGKCAAQLREVAEGLNMRPAMLMPALTLTRATIGGSAPLVPETDFAGQEDEVRRAFGELAALLGS